MTDYKQMAREIVAQGWCNETTKHKEMDVVLAEAIATLVSQALKEAEAAGYERGKRESEAKLAVAREARLAEAESVIAPFAAIYEPSMEKSMLLGAMIWHRTHTDPNKNIGISVADVKRAREYQKKYMPALSPVTKDEEANP